MAEQKKTVEATVRSTPALAADASVRRATREVHRGGEGPDRVGRTTGREHDR